jgi:hypothetical protein
MELQQVFKYKNFKVELYYNGSNKMPNKVFIDDVEIYSDNTYRPSPMQEIDTPNVMVSLIDFYVIPFGGTDKDYFEKRNCPKLDDWANNSLEADEIRFMIYDFMGSYDDSFLTENELTLEYARRIEQYIEIF